MLLSSYQSSDGSKNKDISQVKSETWDTDGSLLSAKSI